MSSQQALPSLALVQPRCDSSVPHSAKSWSSRNKISPSASARAQQQRCAADRAPRLEAGQPVNGVRIGQDQLVAALRAAVRDEVRQAAQQQLDAQGGGVLRAVLRYEMEQLVDSERFRKVLREEVTIPLAATDTMEHSDRSQTPRTPGRTAMGKWGAKERPEPEPDELGAGPWLSPGRIAGGVHKEEAAASGGGDAAGECRRSSEAEADEQVEDACKKLVRRATQEEIDHSTIVKDTRSTWIWLWFAMWQRLKEPPRDCVLANFEKSQWTASFMSSVIMADIVLMMYTADSEISSTKKCDHCAAANWPFQIVYTAELMWRLALHRQWFFCNGEYRRNWFDFVIVLIGWVALVAAQAAGSPVRVLRFARLGKGLRALKVLTGLRELQVFINCLQSSFLSFFWAVAVLVIILMIFSLILVNMVSFHNDEGVELTSEARDKFGSVLKAMMTLFQASTGGADWAEAYDVISEIGLDGGVVYLGVITFIQFAVMNIITGIYVDAAMSTLSRDMESSAVSQEEFEQSCERQVKYICSLADPDDSGYLTHDQFDQVKGRVTRLLAMMGLKKEHVIRLFSEMSVLSEDGTVRISRFVVACMRTRGAATNFDMQMALEELRRALQNQCEVLEATVGKNL